MNKYVKGKIYTKSASFGPAKEIKSGNVTKMKTILDENAGTKDQQQEDTYRFCISSQAVDRDGEVVVQEGIDYKDFENNPVVLWGHEWGSMPIGKVTKLYYDDIEEKTYADVKFASTPRAQEVKTLVKEGMVRTTSIGFMVDDWDWNETTGIVKLTKTKLLELSIVAIPANPDAYIDEGEKQMDKPVEGKKSLTAEEIAQIVRAEMQTILANEETLEGASEEPKAEDSKEDVKEDAAKEDDIPEEPKAEESTDSGADLNELIGAINRLVDRLDRQEESEDKEDKETGEKNEPAAGNDDENGSNVSETENDENAEEADDSDQQVDEESPVIFIED